MLLLCIYIYIHTHINNTNTIYIWYIYIYIYIIYIYSQCAIHQPAEQCPSMYTLQSVFLLVSSYHKAYYQHYHIILYYFDVLYVIYYHITLYHGRYYKPWCLPLCPHAIYHMSCVYTYVCMYIYIYIERERERDRHRCYASWSMSFDALLAACLCVHNVLYSLYNILHYYTILYYIILYYTIQYNTRLYYTTLYYTILYHRLQMHPSRRQVSDRVPDAVLDALAAGASRDIM